MSIMGLELKNNSRFSLKIVNDRALLHCIGGNHELFESQLM